ncbi:MAG: methyltransferase domain-containing protein [Alphaproteobacteria bacterium]|nr:methyltransferase domain-containing protein [Alphaproteobacteria bacterium]
MTGGESPRLFDRALRRRRAARWLPRFPEHDVLHAHAAALAAEKLLDVTRSFTRACIWGDRGRHLLSLLPPAKVDAAVHADDVALPDGTTVVADAEASPFADEAFDLAVSLLDLHAANDPIGAMIQIARSLKPDGLFIGVMFGAETLNELRAVLAEAEIETAGGLSPRVFPFADVRDAGSLLQRAGFALPVADEDRLTVRYGDPLRLLADLRAAGESNVLTERRRAFLRRDTLGQALAGYSARFHDGGRFRATFSFLTLTGWRPHQSQPQALKPGSGQVSLVQALKDVRS